MKTIVTQHLEECEIPFRILQQNAPASSIEDAARLRGISPSIMVKSMLLRDMGNNYALACCFGDQQIAPKKVRHRLQWRRMTCVSGQDVEIITGYQLGSVCPIKLKTPLPIIFDRNIILKDEVSISSGSNLAGIALATRDLIQLINPLFDDITR